MRGKLRLKSYEIRYLNNKSNKIGINNKYTISQFDVPTLI